MCVDHQNKIVFIHIPKNAGTSVIDMLNGDHGHHPVSYYKRIVKEWNSYRKICILRDPIERFISCYNFAKMRKSRWHDIDGVTQPKHPDYELCHEKNIHEIIDIIDNNKTQCQIYNLGVNADRQLKHLGWKTQSCWLDYNRSNIEFVSMSSFCEYFERNFRLSPDSVNVTTSQDKVIIDEHYQNILRDIYSVDYELIDNYIK